MRVNFEQDRNKGFNFLYERGVSERDSRLGELARVYNLPKYVDLFFRCLGNETNLEVLELGAGRGQITKLVLNSNRGQIKNYIATEITDAGVAELRKLGIHAEKIDAGRLPFADKSFDLVCCFDVMHHVPDCKKMADEMARVSRKYIFLIEANGLCLLRKLLEMTSYYRKFNESSYSPRRYRSFFPQEEFEEFTIKPFLFTPPYLPKSLYKFSIIFSEILERIPILRFQCSGLVIFGKKKLKKD